MVVPRLYEKDYAFLLSNLDGRVVFVIPYLEHFSLIGTTDVPFHNDPYAAGTSRKMRMIYLCDAVNRYFAKQIKPSDSIWNYSGVRPLHTAQRASKNLSTLSRDYYLELNTDGNSAPLLSVFGGKITTYRKLAEHALKLLNPFFPIMKSPWTATTPLPGGNLPTDFNAFVQELQSTYAWLPASLCQRYARSYGTLTEILLKDARQLSDLGNNLGADLYEREVQYLKQYEWAQRVEDILWRRTKLGLFFPPENKSALEQALNY